MIVDTHMHTRFSTDSTMRIEDAIDRSRELGIGITITEHLDLDYPTPEAFIFDIDEYFREYGRYRSDDVLLGIEIGMRCELVAENRRRLEGQPFDYVIGSIHVVEGIDIYQEEFYLDRTKREVYGQYFESMVSCLDSYDFIDSLGHIDYIVRYARFDNPELYMSEFGDYIDKVLAITAEKQKALEINTRRLGDRAAVDALMPVYRRFYELGGRMVTIGSDAHVPQDIGKHFDVAFAMAEACKLKPVYFKERNPNYVK